VDHRRADVLSGPRRRVLGLGSGDRVKRLVEAGDERQR
jgi:hypothetical protein